MKDEFYKDLDEIKNNIVLFLNACSYSSKLQNHFCNLYSAIAYGTLCKLFFDNLTKENIIEMNLPKGQISTIKKTFKNELSLIKKVSVGKSTDIDEKYYKHFKLIVFKQYPDFYKIFHEIEEIVDILLFKKKLLLAKKEFSLSGKKTDSFHDNLITTSLEKSIESKSFPSINDYQEKLKSISKEILPSIVNSMIYDLHNKKSKIIKEKRKENLKFNKRLYSTWKEPLEIFEYLIEISLNFAEIHDLQLENKITHENNHKYESLKKIHGRALHISNEILVLLKNGYSDGAHARWRSIHELAIISLFLSNQRNEVSKRYLDYSIIRSFKEAKEYRELCKKSGYAGVDIRIIKRMQKEVEELEKQYGDHFKANKDYNWIPKSILPQRDFKELEKYVNTNLFRPVYNHACDNVHGGSKGFYRIGLMDNNQEQVLLIGPSNYGLADPIQNTIISLTQITTSFLTFEPDFESILNMKVVLAFIKDVSQLSNSVQEKIEIDTLHRL